MQRLGAPFYARGTTPVRTKGGALAEAASQHAARACGRTLAVALRALLGACWGASQGVTPGAGGRRAGSSRLRSGVRSAGRRRLCRSVCVARPRRTGALALAQCSRVHALHRGVLISLAVSSVGLCRAAMCLPLEGPPFCTWFLRGSARGQHMSSPCRAYAELVTPTVVLPLQVLHVGTRIRPRVLMQRAAAGLPLADVSMMACSRADLRHPPHAVGT